MQLTEESATGSGVHSFSLYHKASLPPTPNERRRRRRSCTETRCLVNTYDLDDHSGFNLLSP
jgi:hypothetical protein